jgi:hypothetical protein
MKNNSSDISDVSNSKNKENNKEKSHELILNNFNSNINKKELQKSFCRNKKANKDKKNTNLTFKIKIEKEIDISNRVENDNSSTSEYENKSQISDIKNEEEKFILNSFSNLSKTNEKSFQINSIYENLNNITNNNYGSNPELQLKIKNVLIKDSALILHNGKRQLSEKDIFSKFSVKSLKDFRDIDEEKKTEHSFINSKLKSFRSGSKNNDSKLKSFKTVKKEEEVDPENFPLKKFNSLSKFQSSKMNKKNDNMPSRKTRYKSPRKKGVENFGMSKKLNIINQNIQGASKNINNPEEFYVNFFNDIIKKNTQDKKIEKCINKTDNNNKGSSNLMKEAKGKKVK